MDNTCEYLKTEHKQPCDYYLGEGVCGNENYFRCIEFIKHKEPIISHSGLISFMQCPLRYYNGSVSGWRLKPFFESDSLKIGSAVDAYITKSAPVLPFDQLWAAKTDAIISACNTLFNYRQIAVDYTGQREFTIIKDDFPRITGKIDLHARDNTHFIELKVSKSPDYYTNHMWMRSQLGMYFLSNPSYEYCWLWVIKVPQLKSTGQFKNETLAEYSERCFQAMVNYPYEYFPGYHVDTEYFGKRIYRHEIDMDGIEKRIRVITKQIQQAQTDDYYYPNETSCLYPFECDYYKSCWSGGLFSDDIYERRGK